MRGIRSSYFQLAKDIRTALPRCGESGSGEERRAQSLGWLRARTKRAAHAWPTRRPKLRLELLGTRQEAAGLLSPAEREFNPVIEFEGSAATHHGWRLSLDAEWTSWRPIGLPQHATTRARRLDAFSVQSAIMPPVNTVTVKCPR